VSAGKSGAAPCGARRMAVFSGGQVDRKMAKSLSAKGDDMEHHAPLMGAKERARSKRSWYRQTQTWVGVGVVAAMCAGVSTLFLEHGGDQESQGTDSQGTKHYVPWGRESPERIRSDRRELARARARLERAIDKPVANPRGPKDAAKQKLAAKKKVNSAKDFNHWLDKHHQPEHTLAAALHEYEKKHGYKAHILKSTLYCDLL